MTAQSQLTSHCKGECRGREAGSQIAPLSSQIKKLQGQCFPTTSRDRTPTPGRNSLDLKAPDNTCLEYFVFHIWKVYRCNESYFEIHQQKTISRCKVTATENPAVVAWIVEG